LNLYPFKAIYSVYSLVFTPENPQSYLPSSISPATSPYKYLQDFITALQSHPTSTQFPLFLAMKGFSTNYSGILLLYLPNGGYHSL